MIDFIILSKCWGWHMVQGVSPNFQIVAPRHDELFEGRYV